MLPGCLKVCVVLVKGADMEVVLAAAITGLFAFAGTWFTVRQNRTVSTSQHVEQTGLLHGLRDDLLGLTGTVQTHRELAEQQIQQLVDSQDVLLNLITEVDSKVTKSSNRRKVTDRNIEVVA